MTLVQVARMLIRNEEPRDAAAIEQTIRNAFESAEHSSGTEARIVAALRRAGALSVSLVAIEDEAVVGHVAVSPVVVADREDWYGLGPVAVRADRQRQGVGSRLVTRALDRIRERGAAGCVVLGDPGFYGKFGFVHDPDVTYADVPPPYFQVLSFGPDRPKGPVRYHAAFDA
jgi:putative acetyltransferase